MSMHILENSFLRVSVADAGAELISVMDKEKDAERIWIGDPAVWNRHAPLLFPFVGKVMDGKYRSMVLRGIWISPALLRHWIL